jgi:ketosteroid isomerase-like protein
MMGSSDEREIEALFRTYVDSVNRHDVEGISRLFSFPAMMGGLGNSPLKVPDEAAYRSIIEKTLEGFRDSGWARTQIEHVEAIVTGGGTGYAFAEFSRQDGDGRVINIGTAIYGMVKRDDRWTMISALG